MNYFRVRVLTNKVVLYDVFLETVINSCGKGDELVEIWGSLTSGELIFYRFVQGVDERLTPL